MKLVVPVLRSAILLVLGGGLAFAQLSTPAAMPAAAGGTTGAAGHAAQVGYSHGQLVVDADNSSLNQILHEIARVTGMKITGSVADGRVFGKYGPGAPTGILESLLDGAGVNVLLRETATGAPAELILTPRNGPPTPPNPAAQQAQDVPAPAPPARVGDPGTEDIVVRDINGNPAPVGSAIPPPAAPPPTPEQQQQQIQRMQQQQQEFQQRQRAGQH
jgi:hypothetical protein